MRWSRFVLLGVFAAMGLWVCARPSQATVPSPQCEPWALSTFTAPAGLQQRDRYGMGDPGAPAWQDPGAGWTLPSDVALDVRIVRQTTTEIVAEAVLENRASAPRTVYLVRPAVGLSVSLVGTGVTFLPSNNPPAPGITPPPHTFPEPVLYVLPARARWRFEATLDLRCWQRAPGARPSLAYTFSLSGNPRRGTLPLEPR